jgi:two-component system sensor histidine kinase/response regulator
VSQPPRTGVADKEASLLARAEQLALVQGDLGVVTWIWDVGSAKAQWYGDLSPLLGLPRGSHSHDLPGFIAHLHPDDAAASRPRFLACLKGELPSYHAEERVIWPDGSVHWLETLGRGSYGADGRATRLAGVVTDITERKEAEQALLAIETRFRRLIEAAPVAIGISRGEQPVYGNPSFMRLFGFQGIEALARLRVTDLIAPRARPEFSERSRRRKAGEAVTASYETVAQRSDGGEFDCLVSVTDVVLEGGDATLVFLQDMSERVRAEAALRRERDRANQYLQVAQSILVAFDDQARVTLLNRKGHQVLGYEDGELLGQDWFGTCLPPDEVEPVSVVYRELMAGRIEAHEYHENHVLTKRGERRYIAWRNVVIRDADGHIVGTLSSGEDITERRSAERELRQLNASLELRVAERTQELEAINAALAEARDAAEAASRTKAEFLANMSHEIRTPMNAVLGMTDLALREAVLSPKARSYLSKTRHAAESLLGIINDILDFSKIEAGKLDIEAGEFALDDVFERVTTLTGPSATAKGLDFLISTAPDVPRQLVGDPLRLGQVLLNLCSNAVKFTEQGEILVVAVKADPATSERPMLRFAVRDTGIGMNDEQLGRLFRPFGQLDASTTRRFGGTGLGLAICKQLVEMMGGEIGVRSEVGRSSEFHFTLPYAPAKAVADEAPERPFEGLRVLVVDDSPNACEVLTGRLVALGCRADSVESVAAAMLALHGAPRDAAYEVVLLDWKMPGGDGFEAARQIRASGSLALQPKLVLVTAYRDEAVAQRALAEGFDGYLDKPVSSSALAMALGALRGEPAHDGSDAEAAIELIEQLNGRRILLVEDNELNQIVATDLLAGVAGAIVDVAVNGREAIARAGARHYDAVLMDLQMPEMDGYAATAALRSDPAHARLPVIAMTAHAMARDRQMCLAAGMNDFISKPFEPRELFAVIARWLPQSAAQQAVAAADRSSGAGPGGGISFERGLHRCLGRHDLYARVLRRYFETRADDVDQLRAALGRADSAAAAALAHTVISAAGTIGAETLSAVARDLQQALDAEPTEPATRLVEAFERQHRLVMRQLQAFLVGRDEI